MNYILSKFNTGRIHANNNIMYCEKMNIHCEYFFLFALISLHVDKWDRAYFFYKKSEKNKIHFYDHFKNN